MNIIEIVLNNLMALLPFVIIKTYERGVRYSFGKHPKELTPGFHWKLWVYHHIEVGMVSDDYIETPIQSVITKDGKLIVFSVNIGYRIVDIVKHYTSVQEFTDSTKALAMVHLAKKVRETALADVDLRKLEASLRGTLTNQFEKWGTRVFQVGFVNFSEVPQQIRLFSDNGMKVVL